MVARKRLIFTALSVCLSVLSRYKINVNIPQHVTVLTGIITNVDSSTDNSYDCVRHRLEHKLLNLITTLYFIISSVFT